MNQSRPTLVATLSLAILLFAPSLDAQPASNTPAYQLEDTTGDVSIAVMGAGGSPAVPSVGFLRYVDMTSFMIEENDAFHLRVHMKNDVGFTPREASGVLLGGISAYHLFTFRIPGTDASPAYGMVQAFSYFAEAALADGQGAVSDVIFCVTTSPEDWYCGFNAMRLEPEYHEGTLSVDLPKQWLTRSGPFAQFFQQLPSRIRAGETLTQVGVRGIGNVLGYTYIAGESAYDLRDEVPNDGNAPDFVFQYPSVTDDLTLTLNQVGVVAGEENVVGFELRNLADRKRLVNLVVEVQDMEGEWTIKTVPNVTVRSRDVLNTTLRITPPTAGNGPPPSVHFLLRADVVTEPGTVAVVPVSMFASKPLDRGAHTWYVHTDAEAGLFSQVPVDAFRFVAGWATRAETEPDAEDVHGVPMYFSGGGGSVDFETSLLAIDGIPNPVRLLGEPATAHIVIDSPFPMDVTVTSNLGTGEEAVAAGSTEASLQRGRNEVDIEMPLGAAAERLTPADGQIQWEIRVNRPGAEGIGLALASIADSPELLPKESWFDLPVERELVIPPDPDLPDVALTAADDHDAFINPGRRTVFEWNVRNEHTTVVELELVVENLTRTWEHGVEPAALLRLPPDKSVRVAVFLDAPEGAKEGEICELRLVLKEPETGRVFAGDVRRAIVTTGVDVENETFEPEDADLAAIKAPQGRSPGLGFAIVIGVVGALAFALRRRTGA